MKPLHKSSLSPAWRVFVNACQRINFGVLEDVQFQDGEPVGRANALKTLSFGGHKNNGAAPDFDNPNAMLRDAWHEVIALTASKPHLVVRRFELAHGNPLKLTLEEVVEVTHA